MAWNMAHGRHGLAAGFTAIGRRRCSIVSGYEDDDDDDDSDDVDNGGGWNWYDDEVINGALDVSSSSSLVGETRSVTADSTGRHR